MKSPKCPVIYIYVASAVDIDDTKFKNCLAWKGSGQNDKDWDRAKLKDNHFVCCMDSTRSIEVFGETFDTLLRLMKNRPART